MDRRTALKVLLALSAAGVTPAAEARPLDPQEQAAIEHMRARGVTSFLMLNKRRGVLLAVRDGQIQSTLPAISGEDRGDDRKTALGATGANIYALTISPEQEAYNADMWFERNPNGTLNSIHRLPEDPLGRRLKRLEKAGPASDPGRDRRMSAGCINLRSKDYDLASAFARSARQTMNLPNGEPGLEASFLVVLPESPDPRKTIEILSKFTLK